MLNRINVVHIRGVNLCPRYNALQEKPLQNPILFQAVSGLIRHRV